MTANGPPAQARAEEIDEILQRMAATEETNFPDVHAIDQQSEIGWSMRPLLMDFIIENHASCALLPETLFLAVQLLDRYSSKIVIWEKCYWLVGCVCLWIASKYVEKHGQAPKLSELEKMCFGLYEPSMFIRMEMHVLNTLGWYLGHPTACVYVELSVAAMGDEAEVEHMSAYLCEIALYHRDFVSTRPSVLSRVSLALARVILGRHGVHSEPWSHTEPVALALRQHLAQSSLTLASKYASPDLSCVSETLAGYINRQEAIIERAVNSLPPNELVAKSSSMNCTPQKGCGAAMGFSGFFTPPSTPGSAYTGKVQAYASSSPWTVTSTYLLTQPATRVALAQNELFPVNHLQNRSSTMNSASTRVLSPQEAAQMRNLLLPVDYYAGKCDNNKQTDVWRRTEDSDLPPVSWLEGGCNDTIWDF